MPRAPSAELVRYGHPSSRPHIYKRALLPLFYLLILTVHCVGSGIARDDGGNGTDYKWDPSKDPFGLGSDNAVLCALGGMRVRSRAKCSLCSRCWAELTKPERRSFHLSNRLRRGLVCAGNLSCLSP